MATWNVKGTFTEACNCEAVCPCIFFSPPTDGSCTVLLGWHIDDGSYDGVSLDGLNAAMVAYSPGHMKDGGWKVALYVDDRADTGQNQALMGIFSGKAGGHLSNLAPLIGEVLGARPATIRINETDGNFSLSVDGVGSAEAQAIEGQNGGAVTVSGHPFAVAPGETGVVARTEKLVLDDYGFKLDVSGKTAMSSPFNYIS